MGLLAGAAAEGGVGAAGGERVALVRDADVLVAVAVGDAAHAMSRMMPPAAPAPMAAEAQSKPSSTLCTTGAGLDDERSAGCVSAGAGRALAAGAASAAATRPAGPGG